MYIYKFFEIIYKNGKNNHKIWRYWNSDNNNNNNNTVVSNKVFFGKKRFQYFVGYKDATKLGPYLYFYQKWVHIEKTLIKLYIFFNKRWWIIRKIQWNLRKS